jgi:hypothetical protein
MPDPTKSLKRISFPDPFDMAIEIKCSDVYIPGRPPEYVYRREKWMKGYMECRDTCTGEISTHWSKPRPVTDLPKMGFE